MKHLKRIDEAKSKSKEKAEFIDDCESFKELNDSIKNLKSAMKKIKKELKDPDEEYVIDYIMDKL